MKRFFLLIILASIGLAFGFCGCESNEDATSPLITGDTSNPDYQAFFGEFEIVSQITGSMLISTFQFIDSIGASSEGVSKPNTSQDFTLTYHEASGYWYCLSSEVDEYDSTAYNLVDSIQFRVGSTVVQWPDLETLTEVRSYLRMTAESQDGSGGEAYQNIVITVTNPGADSIIVNATGGIVASYNHQSIPWPGDTTNCEGELDYNVTATNLSFAMNESDGPGSLPCPYAGSLGFSGSIDFTCTGAEPSSLSGNWNVVESFDDGTINVHISNGQYYWDINGSCD